jgi:hypothetical protein
MLKPALILALISLALPVAAAELKSEYTDLEIEKFCTIVSTSEEADDAASFVCPGWRGYPVIVDTGDSRESVYYGFPPAGERPWESFAAFNAAGPKIEWRIEVDGERQVPLAAIHRWSVNADPDNPENKIEVLAVEKVGQPGAPDSCTVGLVVASGNPKANETARKIADEQAREFACGADERVIVSGDIELPTFDRQEN